MPRHHAVRRTPLWVTTIALIATAVGCDGNEVSPAALAPASSPLAPADAITSSAQALYARSSVLWPVKNRVATIKVCWLPLAVGDERFPVAAYAPDIAKVLPARKAWVREIVEQMWNGATPLRFVGWQDCDGSPADVTLQPMSSYLKNTGCGRLGQSCVGALGTDLKRNRTPVYLNLLFGDETLYSSRYQQVAGGRYQPSDDLPPRFIPLYCFEDFKRPWTTNNALTDHKVDVNDPEVLTRFMSVYKNCVQAVALHEMGHAAGFAHEQYRTDDAFKKAECAAYLGATGGAIDSPAAHYAGTTALGPFDNESIMSYCRQDLSATLSPIDVLWTRVAYLGAGNPVPYLGEDAGPGENPNAGAAAGGEGPPESSGETSRPGEPAPAGSPINGTQADSTSPRPAQAGPSGPGGQVVGVACDYAPGGKSTGLVWPMVWLAFPFLRSLRRR